MSIRNITLLVVSIGFGILAVIFMRSVSSAAKPTTAGQPVVVAARPIPLGAKVEPSMLKVAFYPDDAVPVGAFRAIGQLTGVEHEILRPISLNEPVLGSALSGTGALGHLSSVIRSGARAVTIRSGDIVGVGGFALPGDHVDVLATRGQDGSGGPAAAVNMLAENVLVLGVDQNSAMSGVAATVSKAITLEVSPEQAQSITLAQSTGVLTLSLRHIGDLPGQVTATDPVKHAASRSATVARAAKLGRPRPAVTQVETDSRPDRVEVVRGGQASGYAVGRSELPQAENLHVAPPNSMGTMKKIKSASIPGLLAVAAAFSASLPVSAAGPAPMAQAAAVAPQRELQNSLANKTLVSLGVTDAGSPVTSSAPSTDQKQRGELIASTAGKASPVAAVPRAFGSATLVATRPVDFSANIDVGKSQEIQLSSAYGSVMIADPKIADIEPLTGRSFNLEGKAVGTTGLNVYDADKHLLASFDVVVSPDLMGLKMRLGEILPQEKNLAIRSANESIALSGTVSSPVVLKQALALAEAYSPGKVINMLGVEGTQQVMLSVRFVEIDRAAAKNINLNTSGSTLGGTNLSASTGANFNSPAGFAADTFGKLALKFNGNLDLMLDALESKGIVKTLAEPNLVAMSGDTATFLAGGEFPIPVAQSPGGPGVAPTTTVEFKQFGVALAFTPTILSDGMINIVVNPEVSSIDPNVSVQIGSISVPGLKVRRGHTTVELRDGESFAIAGLLSNSYQTNVSQFPFIGDMPILGALFRSTGYKKDETELVVIITPHLVDARRAPMATPADNFVPPSDYELFMLGQMQSRNSAQALKPDYPSATAVEGRPDRVTY